MKILVVNKDTMDRTVIQQLLVHSGHELVWAEDSQSAMQILQEGEIRFVVADRTTTDIDQFQFVQRVRAAQPPFYIYILLLTDRDEEIDDAAPKKAADDYLLKPLNPLELKSRVRIGERILNLGDSLMVAKDTMERVAMYDTLTGVLNQKAFLIFSRAELERARRGQSPFSMIALEVDNLQSISDKYGENIANDVLVVMAKAIRERSRPYDGVGRFEGNLFLITLTGVIGQDAEKIAERILKGILNTNISLLDGTELSPSISAGVACVTRISASTEIEMLVETAKEATAHARREGGNQSYMVFM